MSPLWQIGVRGYVFLTVARRPGVSIFANHILLFDYDLSIRFSIDDWLKSKV